MGLSRTYEQSETKRAKEYAREMKKQGYKVKVKTIKHPYSHFSKAIHVDIIGESKFSRRK